VQGFLKDPNFKGYVSDVGGPTANFRQNACPEAAKRGTCRNRNCLGSHPCPNLKADESDFLQLLRKLRHLPGIRKVFIRSGIRFDYLLADPSRTFFKELIEHHVSGQLKVAPEHCVDSVLDQMGKPHWDVFSHFSEIFEKETKALGKEQYLVPYLISSHPGATLSNAIEMALTLHHLHRQPEQVQDFYPTPGTLSTCMYYTGLDIESGAPIHVARTQREKAAQRALLQWKNPKNEPIVVKALLDANRPDLIGVFYPRKNQKNGKPKATPKATPSGRKTKTGHNIL
jgi:uncharacterized radical SAM protein YgiQ